MKILIDIDGTLADTKQLAEESIKDGGSWDSFLSLTSPDVINILDHPIIFMIRSILRCDVDNEVVFWTGRREKHRVVTEKWLFDNNFKINHTLLMRPDDSKDDSSTWKTRTLISIPMEDILLVIDDDKDFILAARLLNVGSILVK